ncbi:MAG TPA: hypothetical protein VJ769_08000, partial [Actinomycetes bacterium]|nr:hypothetical protein [Actinomycetes bacterium]
TDYGDVIHVEQYLVKGRHLDLTWHLGAPRDTAPADRTAGPPGTRTGRGDITVDLKADKALPLLAPKFKDEVGNEVPAPPDVVVDYSVDDPSIINLTDNGDGTGLAAATGTLGQATVHVEANFGSRTATGDLLIVVVAGDAERVEIVTGEPVEVTPDA